MKRRAHLTRLPGHMPAPLVASRELLQQCKLPQQSRGTFLCICKASLQAAL